MKQLSIFFFFILSFKGYSQCDTLKIEKEYWSNGKIKSTKIYSDLYYFSFISWYKNGQKLSEGLYSDDFFIKNSWDTLGNKLVTDGEGQQINFYENGIKKEIGTIHGGLPSGLWTEYHLNNQKKSQGTYKSDEGYDQGRKYGLWTFWNEKGRKIEEREYTNDFFEYWNAWDNNGNQIIKEGIGYLKEYYPNHKLKAEGAIKNGKKWGNWKEWYNNGNLKEEYKYEEWTGNYSDATKYKFVLINSWDSLNNQITKNGTGWHLEFNEQNQLTFKSYYINGIQDSLSISYYPNGGQFVVDKYKNGNWIYRTIYHDNGNKAYEYNREYGYDNNGVVRTWFYNGTLMLEEHYDKGTLISKTKYYDNGQKEVESMNCKKITEPIEGEEGMFGIFIKCENTYWKKDGTKKTDE